MVRFSILIPIHNRLEITKRGLRLLYTALENYTLSGGSKCRFEVIVIDDGSKDGSSEWISGNYPAIHLIKGDGNLWWSGAINKGASYAIDKLDSDYLLLWNDDIYPDDHYFLQVEKLFRTHSFEDAIIGSTIMFKRIEGKVWSLGGYFNKMTGSHGLYNNPEAAENGFLECDWLPGMGTFVSASIIKKHKLWWDEKRFPQYHGDSDFTLRCKEKGIRIATCLTLLIYNDAEVRKIGKANSFKDLVSSLISKRSNYNFRKRVLFYRIHGTPPFVYRGLLKSYFFYIGSYLKHKIVRA